MVAVAFYAVKTEMDRLNDHYPNRVVVWAYVVLQPYCDYNRTRLQSYARSSLSQPLVSRFLWSSDDSAHAGSFAAIPFFDTTPGDRLCGSPACLMERSQRVG